MTPRPPPSRARLVAFPTDPTAFFEDAPEHLFTALEAHFGDGVGTEPITALPQYITEHHSFATNPHDPEELL